MKRRIAEMLRRMAHRLAPQHLESYVVSWRRNDPPHVDIRFRNGQRVIGYVDGQP